MDNKDTHTKLTTESIPKLLVKMAIPSTFAMLIGVLYSLVDTFFVSKISVSSTASVGLAFSFMSVTQALGLLFGHGSGNYISRMEGAKNREESSKMAIEGLIISFISGLIIMFLGFKFIDKLVLLLGAKDELISLTKDYLSILLIGTPFMISSLTVNNQLRLQGKPGIGAVAIMSGVIINCVLDPILIFVLNLGIRGAAYATIAGQIIGFFILILFNRLKGSIKFCIKNFSINSILMKELFGGGLPNFTREIFIAVSLFVLNNKLKTYGELYIASFTLVNRIILAGTYIMVGFGHGFQPICGVNYGAKLYDRVKKSFNFTLKIAIVFMIFIQLLFYIGSETFISIFRNEVDIINIGSKILRIQSISLPLVGYITIAGMFLQNTHEFKKATLVTTARQGSVYIPLIYLLHSIWGLNGILYVQPIADVITFFISVVLVYNQKLKIIENANRDTL